MAASERDQTIVALHQAGFNLSQIGRRYDITRERVRQIVQRETGETLTRRRWATNKAHRQRLHQAKRQARAEYRASLDFIRDRTIEDDNGCWIWQRSRHLNGYGHTTASQGGGYAHRAAWERANGPILDGLIVCHHCDVPACVNPDHLFLGTYKDNIQDSVRKGRFTRNRRNRPPATHCRHGHEFTPENTYIVPKTGSRHCRACNRAACERYDARKRAAA